MKLRALRALLLASVLLAPVLLAPGKATAQQVTLKANLQGVLTSPYGLSLSRFKAEVEKASNGAIAVEIFDKGRLYTDGQVVDAVTTGAIDIGTTATQQFASKVPAVGIIDMPFLFNFPTLVQAAAAPESDVRKLIDGAILKQLGARVLWWQPLGDTVFFSKGFDVADPERLKGRTVAVPGKALEEAVARCGGKPAAVSVERFHDSVRDGTTEMAMISMPGMLSWSLWKVTDTITYTAHSPVEFLLVINERRWQSLAPDHRDIIATAAKKVERVMRGGLAETEAKLHAFAAAKGMSIRTLTPDQVSEWRACSAAMLADYMERNGEMAQRIMAAYAKLRTDACCTAGPAGVFTRR
ncbi:MAG TPA: TRAP transporter substrate-binding protein DctP [Hyphomicrobiaceae bacterium]|nr:TRAP transporter substrate-binding protein DctP [Hyphomicrobiaceae bacterium]